MKNIMLMFSLALFLLSCGSSSNNSVIENTQDMRISQVIETRDNSSVEIYYEYNNQNLLLKKTSYSENEVVEEEDFIYNINNQLLSQSKFWNINLFYSQLEYIYGDTFYASNNLPLILSSSARASFAGSVTSTNIEYIYTLNEQNSATHLDSTILSRTTTGIGSIIPENDEVIEYSYDENNRLILKNTRSYSYNEFNKLASENESNFKILYTYNESEQIILAESFSRTSESQEWKLTLTQSYLYENGTYNSSTFTPNYFDQGQYINSGIY